VSPSPAEEIRFVTRHLREVEAAAAIAVLATLRRQESDMLRDEDGARVRLRPPFEGLREL